MNFGAQNILLNGPYISVAEQNSYGILVSCIRLVQLLGFLVHPCSSLYTVYRYTTTVLFLIYSPSCYTVMGCTVHTDQLVQGCMIHGKHRMHSGHM